MHRTSQAHRRLAFAPPSLALCLLLTWTLRAGDPVPDAGDPDVGDEGVVLIAEGATWRFVRGATAPPEGWTEPGFDDSAWEQGPTGIGYGDGDDNTILEDMRCTLGEGGEGDGKDGGEGTEGGAGGDPDPAEGKGCVEGGYLAFFARAGFERPEIPEGERLYLKVSYDDGFVVHLNGVEVRRLNMPDGEITFQTAASKCVGDAPAEPDAIVLLPPELLVEGVNVIAASVHNCNLSSSDASFVPRLIVGTTEGEPPPKPDCEETCALHAAAVFAACLKEGQGEEVCGAKRQAAFDECVAAKCGEPPPKPEPTCKELCAKQASEAYRGCIDAGNGETECKEQKLAAFEDCLAAECGGESPKPECQEECAETGDAVFLACLESGGDEEECRARADAIVSLCLARCGAGAPCESRCATASQIVLTSCDLTGLPEDECKALANDLLERCMVDCKPESCAGGCEELSARAAKECRKRGGTEEACADEGASVLAECIAHCEGKPVPSCDEQCEGKAAGMLEKCLAEGGSEADCAAERERFLADCRAKLGEVCDTETLALFASFQPFLRGDADGDGVVDITDPIVTLGYLFLGAGALPCDDAADANDDGKIDVSDPVSTLNFLFLGAGPLPEPSAEKGQDPTSDLLVCGS